MILLKQGLSIPIGSSAKIATTSLIRNDAVVNDALNLGSGNIARLYLQYRTTTRLTHSCLVVCGVITPIFGV